MGLVTVLYVFVKVSLFLPQWVEVRAFSILIVFSALSFEVLICSLNVSLGSKVSPSILGLRIVGSRVLSSCSDSSSLYSAGSGVKSVVIVLLALSFRSFAFVQVCTTPSSVTTARAKFSTCRHCTDLFKLISNVETSRAEYKRL